MPHRVLIPRADRLRLRRWDRARELMRQLATEPAPTWARQVPGGWKVELGGGEWFLYRVDDKHVTVVVFHAA